MHPCAFNPQRDLEAAIFTLSSETSTRIADLSAENERMGDILIGKGEAPVHMLAKYDR